MLTKSELNDDILYKLHIEDKLSAKKIAEKLGSSYKAVYCRLRELGIMRSKSEAAKISIRAPITEEGKKHKSEAKSKEWSDPNSVYNSLEFRKKQGKISSINRKKTLSDPEKLASWLEAIKIKT